MSDDVTMIPYEGFVGEYSINTGYQAPRAVFVVKRYIDNPEEGGHFPEIVAVFESQAEADAWLDQEHPWWRRDQPLGARGDFFDTERWELGPPQKGATP